MSIPPIGASSTSSYESLIGQKRLDRIIQKVDAFFDERDSDGNNQVDVDEYLSDTGFQIGNVRARRIDKEVASFLLDRDTDGNGKLNAEELGPSSIQFGSLTNVGRVSIDAVEADAPAVLFRLAPVVSATTFVRIEGNQGAGLLRFDPGASAGEIRAQISALSLITGVSASQFGNTIRLSSQTTGADAFVSVTPLNKSFFVDPEETLAANGQAGSVAAGLDENGDGQLDRDELIAAYRNAVQSIANPKLSEARFYQIDENGDNEIDRDELIKSKVNNVLLRQEAIAANLSLLGYLDQDGSRTLTPTELTSNSVRLFRPERAGSLTIDVAVSATAAKLAYFGTNIADATTIRIKGNLGAESLTLDAGMSLQSAANTINTFSTATGVMASAFGGNITLASKTIGTDAFVSVTPLEGNFIIPTGNTIQSVGDPGRVNDDLDIDGDGELSLAELARAYKDQLFGTTSPYLSSIA